MNLALVVFGGAWSIADVAIAVIIFAAVVAVVWVALRQFQITPPSWVIQLLWILLVAFVCVAAIRLLMAM